MLCSADCVEVNLSLISCLLLFSLSSFPAHLGVVKNAPWLLKVACMNGLPFVATLENFFHRTAAL